MKKRSILFSLLFLSFSSFSKTPYTLTEAVQQKVIALKILGEGGHEAKSIKVVLTNLSKKEVRVLIPAGQIFHSADTFLQDLIIIKEREVLVAKNDDRIIKLYGNCIQPQNASPSSGSIFNLGLLASGNLLKIAQFISNNNLHENTSVQDAIWSITDNHRLEYIQDAKLATFVAGTLGKKAPEYAILRERTNEANQPAFQDFPVKLEGVFRYETQADCLASLGLYDEEDQPIHFFFKNRKQLKGFHKFKFFFEIRNLPKGKYTVKMVSGTQTLKEMAVEF